MFPSVLTGIASGHARVEPASDPASDPAVEQAVVTPSTAFLPGGYDGECPVCQGPALQAARYPPALCGTCTASAICAAHGRVVGLVGGSVGGGAEPAHRDDGTPCDGQVLVRGVPCVLQEARFGGCVVQPVSPAP